MRALPVQSAEDRVEHDPQLRQREMYLEIEHPALGRYKVQNAPFKLSETPAVISRPSPMIGEHTQEIVEGLLGLSATRNCSAGFADGTFWPTKRPRFPYQEEMMPVSDALPLPGPLSGLRVLELADQTRPVLRQAARRSRRRRHQDRAAGRRAVPPHRAVPRRYPAPGAQPVVLVLQHLEARHHARHRTRRTGASCSGAWRRRPMSFLRPFGPAICPRSARLRDAEPAEPRSDPVLLDAVRPDGPVARLSVSDLLHMAAGGEMASSGYDEADVPNAPPIAPGGGNAWHMGCHFAYMAIMAALVHRTASGRGQYIDASIHEACALTTESADRQLHLPR